MPKTPIGMSHFECLPGKKHQNVHVPVKNFASDCPGRRVPAPQKCPPNPGDALLVPREKKPRSVPVLWPRCFIVHSQ